MSDLYKIIQRHFRGNRNLYVVYSVVTILLLLIIYLFFHKDLVPAHDVIVVLDIGFIAFYQLITLPILAFFVMKKNSLRALKKVSEKKMLFGAVNIFIPMFMVLIFPFLYYIINYKSFIDLYLDIYSIGHYSVYFFIGAGLSLFIQYYYLIYTLNVRDKLTKFKPFLLVLIYIIVYLVVGVIFELNYNYDTLDTTTYFKYLHIFENILYGILGILSVVLIYFLLDLYNKIDDFHKVELLSK